ncbi:MAG TPA: type II toxin-antitoxin system HicA family toxin [Gammaproteobacteria bacterium]|nr:type II toxin-antitoxin system HicA family toxin [Gammaproteobacteria bacterium]
MSTRAYGCDLLREDGRHSWWHNPNQNKRSSVPRHNEIDDLLANKICKDLGITPVK